MTRGRSPATLAVIRSEAELRSLEAAVVQSANGAPYRNRREGHTTDGRRTSPSLTVFLGKLETPLLRRTPRKIDQSISIVCETEQIADRRNSPMNSTARISGGSGIRFFDVSGKMCLDRSMHYHASEQSSGSEDKLCGRLLALKEREAAHDGYGKFSV
jgi:hypothetical protein